MRSTMHFCYLLCLIIQKHCFIFEIYLVFMRLIFPNVGNKWNKVVGTATSNNLRREICLLLNFCCNSHSLNHTQNLAYYRIISDLLAYIENRHNGNYRIHQNDIAHLLDMLYKFRQAHSRSLDIRNFHWWNIQHIEQHPFCIILPFQQYNPNLQYCYDGHIAHSNRKTHYICSLIYNPYRSNIPGIYVCSNCIAFGLHCCRSENFLYNPHIDFQLYLSNKFASNT